MTEDSDDEAKKAGLINVEIRDIFGLSKPLAKLVDGICRGTGVLYRPRAIREEAKAEADAKIYLAQVEGQGIEIVESSKINVEKMKELAKSGTATRAEARVKRREFLRQNNIEQTASRAVKYLPEEVSEEPVDQDWLTRFFNTSMDVSDEKMQEVWARLLAGELEKPGSYSLRAMEVLKNITARDAIIFEKACRFAFENKNIIIENRLFVTLGRRETEPLLEFGFGNEEKNHLASIGLMLEQRSSWYIQSSNENAMVKYQGKSYILTSPHRQFKESFTTWELTEVGAELCRLVQSNPHQEYLDGFVKHCKSKDIEVRAE